MNAAKPVTERVLANIIVTPDGCWEWQLSTQRGYGKMWVGSRLDGTRRIMLAHRASYEAFVGPIPDELPLDHLCRNTLCVNPAHLEPVTHQENTLRGISPAAQQAKQTHCKRGHPFDAENTYINKKKRYCRICHGLRPASTGRIRPRAKASATGADLTTPS